MNRYFYHLYVCLIFTASHAVFSSQEKRSLLSSVLKKSSYTNPIQDSYSPPKPGTKFDQMHEQEAEEQLSPKPQLIVESKSYPLYNDYVNLDELDALANSQAHDQAMEHLPQKNRSQSIPIGSKQRQSTNRLPEKDYKNITKKWYAYHKQPAGSNR